MTTELLGALHYFCLISEVDDNEIFKICLEYWNHIANALFHEGYVTSSLSGVGGDEYPGYEGMNIRGRRGCISGVGGDAYPGYEGMNIRGTRG